MFRKNYFSVIFTFAIFLIGVSAAAAQTAPVTGTVIMEKADGTKTPVNGALVEVYRTDIKSTLPSDKTNKKGEFSFAGLPMGANFVLSISAPGAKPGYYPNVKAGMEKIQIVLQEGDGKRWTEEEIRSAISNTPMPGEAPRQPSEADKKAKEEYEKQVAEVTARNKEIENKNAVIQKALTDGNTAFGAKDWDNAIVKYSEGIDADPTYAGTAPILLNNKGAALRQRAVTNYNASIKLDQAARAEGMGKVRKDLLDAAESYNKSFTILKNAPVAELTDPKTAEAAKAAALAGAKDTFRLMAQTEQVDPAATASAKSLIPEYVATEADAAKKSEALTTLGDVYRVAGDTGNAIVEYRKAIEFAPNNADALAGLGLSLFAEGETAGNNDQRQEGLNYMVKFVEVAPANHRLKQSVADAVEYLKSQKLTPQKVPATRRKN